MGIQGLLPLLKSIHKPCNLKKFEGKTLAVDAYGWLHRGTVACAMELAKGQPTRKFVDFAMHRVRMLQHFGVIPFLIFDGDYLPSKAATELDREKRREESKRKGQELLNAGKPSQAYLEFQKAVDVTPEMARQLIDELKENGIQYIVAPYEADSQMVYLERKGIVHGILSEDSDLLVFGAKCLLTKLDQYGNCIEVNKADFCACKEITLTGWSDKEFRQMAILSGCDYLASISNMGLKTAYRMVRKHKTIEKVIRMLQFDGKFHVPKGYLEKFYQAELTFLHQRVYCPKSKSLVLHTQPEVPIEEDKMPFIGGYVEPEIAQGVARGYLNPMTKQPIVVQVVMRKTMVNSTPLSSRPQHLRTASSSDAKKGKPIQAFFAPKRIPLGELDINCFTPSPSQQDALRRNPGPWSSSPVPRPYLHRSTTDVQTTPQSAPQPRNSIGRHTRAPTISEPRPAKRVRLCAEEDVGTPTSTIELGPSRFFASAAPEPSPTVRRNAKTKRSKKEDVTIFSDDSVEEAMLSLPDADGFDSQGSRSKIQIFNEESTTSQDSNGQSQNSTLPEETSESQDTAPSLTASASFTSIDELPPTPPKTTSAPARIEKLKERFTFAATPKSNINVHGLPTPASSAQRPSMIPLAVKSNAPGPKPSPFSTKAKLTPLQRLGASVMYRANKPPMTPPQTPLFVTQPPPRRGSILSNNNVPFPEATLKPAAITLPIPDESENKALTGSEDLIIHDSEDDEPLSPVASRLDFGQFVFSR
ncbi:Exodeoxyribonuclease [Lachnellula occidentalis]|uniref:Exodeoxyribonuclease n=1 Tax=Lachnellula occidentalis TaxID=215460 RepID=A0A8H8S231_9HELO|nr:Exodeoxyribonuclease [Lachnellula occidentalis]